MKTITSFRKMLICLALSALSLSVQAQMTSYTKHFLKLHKQESASVHKGKTSAQRYIKAQTNEKQVETIACFVSIDNVSEDAITSRGGVISSELGNQLIVVMPVDSIESLSRVEGIRKIDVARPLRKKTDKARKLTKVEDAYSLTIDAQNAGLKQKYDGTGIVVGIIDTGIEFNHTAFNDDKGNSRVKAVYMPNASKANGGSKKTIDGNEITGYQYTTAEQIKKLTCDIKEESHGTHTSSTAAGCRITTTGITTNVTYGGMAPNADIILCGLGETLSNTAIANSALYIANYAKEHKQPCVISVSLGDNMGPHDGSSSLAQYYDKIAEEYGAIIVLAAGNEADGKLFLSKKMESDTDYLGTILNVNPYGDIGYDQASALGSVDIWNNTSDKLEVAFVVFDSEMKIVYTSPRMSEGEVDKKELEKYFNESALKGYDKTLNQGITVMSEVNNENNRFNLYIDAKLGGNDEGYELGMLVYGNNGNEITMWNDGFTSIFSGYSDDDTPYVFQEGNGTCSICDDVTGKKTISVGAYTSRTTVPIDYGKHNGIIETNKLEEQDIAYFSSYGTDFSGVQHPFITAPGHAVVSAINRHDKSSWSEDEGTSPAAYRYKLTKSTYDYWAYMSGTSMATPTVAGIIALYLQADKNLKVNDVKEVIRNSADTDSFTESVERGIRFGTGKINALKGIKYILDKDTNGIYTIDSKTNTKNAGRIYNLQGQQVRQLQRGINIVNGRKIIKP